MTTLEIQATTGTVFRIGGVGPTANGQHGGLRYVWQSLAGAGSVSARVASPTGTSGAAEAGVMFRQGLGTQAPYYYASVSPGAGIRVAYRAKTGAPTIAIAHASGAAPAYLRVSHTSGVYIAYTSSDGTTWTAIKGSRVSVRMGDTLQAGMAVTGHGGRTQDTATFDTVSVSGASRSLSPRVYRAQTRSRRTSKRGRRTGR